MAQIDTLTLEVNADISKASQKLETLARRLDLLKESTGKAVSGYKNLARELSKINVPSKNLNNILKISNALTSLNSVKGKNIETLASGFSDLTNSLSKLSQFKRVGSQLEKIANIATALNGFNIVMGNNIVKTAKGLTNLVSSVESMPDSVISKIERLGVALQSIPDNTAIRSLGKFKMTSAIGSTPQESGTTTHTGGGGVGEIFSEAKSKIAEAKSLNEVLGVLSTSLKSFKALPAVAIATTVLDGLAKAFKKLISPITNAVKALKGFIKSLARIAFYRFIRSILKEISQGLREGIQNLALYSKAMEGLDAHNANEVLSRFASAFLYLKNAIATAVIPVFRALAPVIEEAMFKIVDFINVLSQIGSSFFGSNFTKAKYFWVDYADSLDKTTGSAKALHHQLAQFDELNNLSAPSGGSGSDKLADASQMFEEAQIDDKIKGIVDKIRGAFETVKGMFEPVKKIVDKAKELFELSWEKVTPNLKRIWNSLKGIWNDTLKPFIKGFIEGFVDGFLSSDTFKNLPDFLGLISDKVADAVEKFEKLTKVLTPDQWERLGKAIGFVTGWVIELITNIITGQSTFSNFLDRVKKLRDYLAETFRPEIEGTKAVIGYLKDKVGEAITKFIEFMNPVNNVRNIIINLQNAYENFSRKAQELADKIANNSETFRVLHNVGNTVRDFFAQNNIFGKTADHAQTLWDKAKGLRDFLSQNNIFGRTADHADSLWSKLFNARTELKNTEDKAVGLKNWFNNNPLFAQAQHSAELFKTILDAIRSALDGLKNFTCNIGFNYSSSGNDGGAGVQQSTGSGSTSTTTSSSSNNKTTTTTTKTGTQSTGQKPNTTQNTTSGRPATTTSSSSNGNYGGFGSLQEYIQAQKKKALGGFVPNGDLFIANEKGAEMIGSIGGNTAVANNNQITEAIAQATYTAMTKALAENGGSVNIVVEGDGDRMFKVFQKKQRENARTMGLAY